MNYTNLRIVFMGTPEFAVASLDALVKAGCNIVAVITAPDKPAGRGLKLTSSAVKQYAVDHNLNILQPEKLKNPDFIGALQNLKADLQVVVAFRMLPEIVWNMPPMGTINVHGSLLPQYRGAAPINWAVINGDEQTGVTTFKLKHEIDTGDILLQASMPITENETAGEVHDKMKELGAEILVKTIKEIATNSLQEKPQQIFSTSTDLRHAPKIFTENCKIDFTKTVNEVHNLIRGISLFLEHLHVNGKLLKIYLSKKEITNHTQQAGSLISDETTFIKFACSNGYIHVLELQLEGKKKMKVVDFLRGNKL
jgi:methionyl-tRNA formyltransferase